MRDLPESAVLGAYWVLYPGRPIARADDFLATLDDHCPGWRDRDAFILQVDCEIWGGNTDTRPPISDINTFCDRLVARTNGKYLPIGYLPKWVYGDVSTFHYPVWASAYVGGSSSFKALYPGDSSARWNPYGKPVAILQYSSTATIGGQTTCDANAYRGTIDQLKALVTPGGDMPITQTDANLIVDTLLNRGLGASQTPTVGVALQSGYGLAGNTNAKVAALATAVAAIMANVTADDGDKAQLLADAQAKFDAISAEVEHLPAAVLAELGSVSPEQAAGAIRQLLGTDERVAAVKALL